MVTNETKYSMKLEAYEATVSPLCALYGSIRFTLTMCDNMGHGIPPRFPGPRSPKPFVNVTTTTFSNNLVDALIL